MKNGSGAESFRTRFFLKLKRFVKRPSTKFAVGMILVFTSSAEVIEDLTDDVPGVKIGAHHGLLVLGILNAISSIPDLVEGLEKTIEGSDEIESDDSEE